MAAIGGPVQEVSIDGRNFAVAGDSDADRSLGGFTNEVSSNGNGTARILKTRVPWKIGGLALEIDDNRSDQEFLKKISDGTDFVNISVTFANGFTYQGKGIITDKLEASTGKATQDVTLSGPGDATQQ